MHLQFKLLCTLLLYVILWVGFYKFILITFLYLEEVERLKSDFRFQFYFLGIAPESNMWCIDGSKHQLN